MRPICPNLRLSSKAKTMNREWSTGLLMVIRKNSSKAFKEKESKSMNLTILINLPMLVKLNKTKNILHSVV
jgi:hypothetical protein